MNLEKKYLEYKKKVEMAENTRSIERSSKTWKEIRDLKKFKLAIKDKLLINPN